MIVDLRDALVEIAGERVRALAAVEERLRHRRLGRQPAQGIVDRVAKRVDLRPGLLLSVSAPDIRRLAADFLFDPVKPGDATEQVGGERRRARLVAREDLAAEVRPAGDLLDAIADGKGGG